MMNTINYDGKEIQKIDFLKVFLSLETFFQKATALNIFESLIFNYKIKVSCLDECSSQFTSFVVDLCNDLKLTLQESAVNDAESSETVAQATQINYEEFEDVVPDNIEYAIPVEAEFSYSEQSAIDECHMESNKSPDDATSEGRSTTPLDDKNKSIYTCNYCNRKYTTVGKLTKHVCKCAPHAMVESQIEEDVDDPEPESRVTEQSAAEQMCLQCLSEPDLPVFVCGFCFTSYRQKEQFDQHNHGTNPQAVVLVTDVEQLKSQRKFSCGVCHEVYRSLGRISYHVARCQAGPYHCELCPHMAVTKQLLNRHKKKQHKGVECFFCTECGLGFKLRTSLQKHQVNRHETEQHLFVCDIENCGQVFSKRIQRTNHKIEVHGVERKFLCQVCGHKFLTQDSLSSHLESHNNKQKFECQYCGKTFRSNEKKIFHVRTHTGEKPFLCYRTGCSKSFISKAKLREHELRHDGEKRHKCGECGKQYANKTDLKAHLRKIHSSGDGSVSQPAPSEPADLFPASAPAHLFNTVQYYPETQPLQLVRTIGVPSSLPVVITSYDAVLTI